jgi:quinol monooxygenase YgiN
MIIENAVITIDPGQAIAFETAVGDCVEIFRAAQGCHGMALLRIVDEPGRYRLIIKWETKAHHAPMFWESPGFRQWRARVAGFFTETPVLEYNDPVAFYF